MKQFPEVDHTEVIVGYDDSCHYHAYMTNPIRANATPEAKLLAKQTVNTDNCPLMGHTDARYRERFNPKKYPPAKDLNTQVEEQTFSWFSKFKHMGRYMGLESYWVFIVGLINERNQICVHRQGTRSSRKRKRSRFI